MWKPTKRRMPLGFLTTFTHPSTAAQAVSSKYADRVKAQMDSFDCLRERGTYSEPIPQ